MKTAGVSEMCACDSYYGSKLHSLPVIPLPRAGGSYVFGSWITLTDNDPVALLVRNGTIDVAVYLPARIVAPSLFNVSATKASRYENRRRAGRYASRARNKYVFAAVTRIGRRSPPVRAAKPALQLSWIAQVAPTVGSHWPIPIQLPGHVHGMSHAIGTQPYLFH